MMVDVDDVIRLVGARPQDLRFEKDDTTSLNSLLEDWISQCEDLIKQYCNNKFEGSVPESVKNVCLRMVRNMWILAIQTRDSPIIKVNDWTINTGDIDIFNDALKEDLAPFVIEHSTVSDTVTFFAITGDEP